MSFPGLLKRPSLPGLFKRLSLPGLRHSPAPQWPLAAVRLYVGVVLTVAGVGQLLGRDPWGALTDWPTSLGAYDAAVGAHMPSVYAAFYRAILVPHKDLFGTTLPALHVALGLALILGVATRGVAAVTLLLLANYMALTGVMPYHPDPVSALAALTLALLLTKPDDVWSVRSVLGHYASRDGRSATIERWMLVPLRLYIGAAFLLETAGRVASWPGWLNEVHGFLMGYRQFAAAPYRPIMDLALRHIALFAQLVFVGEAVVAISLLFGIATRLGAGIGIFLSLNYLLSKGNTPWSFNNDFAFIVAMLGLALTHAGRVAGIDAWSSRRWPRSPLW